MNKKKRDIQNSKDGDIAAFLSKAASLPVRSARANRGRLLFAMDATASREATWDQASQIQDEMFVQTAALGGLDVQLCCYRGFNEFMASDWFSDSHALLNFMRNVYCVGGHTQIQRVLKHAINSTKERTINAAVFVGDCVEEPADDLCQLAGELAMYGVPLFIFHEGDDPTAARLFKQMAKITNGAYCPFNIGSAQQLRDLLSAVAVYAAGGFAALEDYNRKRGRTILRLQADRK